MTSILTNSSAMAALSILRGINASLGAEQGKISSGLRIQSAADNAAYWSIATTMKSDNKALSAVEDALGLGAAILDVTSSAAEASIDVMSEITAKLVAAREPGVDKMKINLELTELKNQLHTNLNSASFNGENWLAWNTAKDSLDKEIVSSFVRDASGNVRIETLKYEINTPLPGTSTDVQYFVDNGGTGEYGILSSEAFAIQAGSTVNYVVIRGASAPVTAIELSIDRATTGEQLDDMISTVEAMTRQMVSMGAQVGAISKRIQMQQDFTAELMDTIDKGIGRLVDADMNQSSARLRALEAQQQLAVKALGIANDQPSRIMDLFR